jgi:37-kD nucleoid-associated bacterial protein
MEQCTNLTIADNFVIHVLDNRLPAVQCSQELTSLPDGFRAALTKYLLALLRPGFRRQRFGRFWPESAVLQEYQRLTTSMTPQGRVDPAVFLDVSQHLAQQLFTAMRQVSENGVHTRPGEITPGDLLVGLFYSRAPEASLVPYLFLIKVDLESGLQRQIRPLARGGIQTVLTPCEGLLPKLTTEHVHKSALIRWGNDPSMYDVLMTDPQGGKQGVAKFFAEDFLRTAPFQTPDEQADLLFQRAHTWVTTHEDTLSPREQQEVLQSVRSLIAERAIRAEPLAPRELVLTLPLSEPRAEQTVDELRQSFQETLTAPEANGDNLPPDRELLLGIVPPRVARTRMTYQLDNGVQLSGDQDALDRLFLTPPHRVGSATEFTIRTTTFRPVL